MCGAGLPGARRATLARVIDGENGLVSGEDTASPPSLVCASCSKPTPQQFYAPELMVELPPCRSESGRVEFHPSQVSLGREGAPRVKREAGARSLHERNAGAAHATVSEP